MATISAFRVTQHSQIFSLFFRNRIQCIALYQLYNFQALLSLRRGYYSEFFHLLLQARTCELCKKIFTHRKDLLRHHRTIHEEKSFECHLCSYKTARKDKLVLYQKVHTKTSSDQTLNVKMKLRLSSHLRKSISRKTFNNHPTLNARSHIKTQLLLPNIHDQKTLLIQSIMNNF